MIIILIPLISMTALSILLGVWVRKLNNQIKEENAKNIVLQNRKKKRDEISVFDEYRQSAIEKDGKIEENLGFKLQFLFGYSELEGVMDYKLTDDQIRAIKKISPLSNVSNTPLINL